MNKPILLSKRSPTKTCILPCATTFEARYSVSDGLWGQRPLIFSPSFFHLPNSASKWLNPSLDNLAPLSLDVFGLTFPFQLLYSCRASSADLTHHCIFMGLISSHTWIQSSSFLQGGCYICFGGDVCFHLEIWTVESWTAHRPVIRDVSDHGEGNACCHPLLHSSEWFFSEACCSRRITEEIVVSKWGQVQVWGYDIWFSFKHATLWCHLLAQIKQ